MCKLKCSNVKIKSSVVDKHEVEIEGQAFQLCIKLSFSYFFIDTEP